MQVYFTSHKLTAERRLSAAVTDKTKISSDAHHFPELLSPEVIPIVLVIFSSRFVAWTSKHIHLTPYLCRSVWTVGLMRTIMNSDTTTAATHKRRA